MSVSPAEIDRATIATWPAAETEMRDGWALLASGGVTGRVNAVWPLEWRGGDLEAAIDAAEAWYAARHLPPRFKLTDGAFAPAELPQALAQRGYEAITPTLIMSAPIAPRMAAEDVLLSTAMPAEFDAVLRAVSKDDAEYDERHAIALRAPQPAAFAMIAREGRAAAIGMAAATGPLAGIFLMRTAPEARRQGLARGILTALLARSAEWGVRTAFLQVEADNASAIALYQSEGFEALSTYCFWSRP